MNSRFFGAIIEDYLNRKVQQTTCETMFRTIALIGLAVIASSVLMSFKTKKHDDSRLGI